MSAGIPSNHHGSRLAQRSAHGLAAGYTRATRLLELFAILAFGALVLGALGNVALDIAAGRSLERTDWVIVLAVVTGLLFADFVSGFVHWAGDTWGRPEWPVIGKALIRPFREHHVDDKAITRHDFLELNGNNCLISLPFLAIAFGLSRGAVGHPLQLFAVCWSVSMTLFVFATNQIHAWAHRDENCRLVRFLQRHEIILSPVHHNEHHVAPYVKSYCITTGWMNRPLDRLRFFPRLETAITALTGAIPRADDIGEEAAFAVMADGAQYEAELLPVVVVEPALTAGRTLGT